MQPLSFVNWRQVNRYFCAVMWVLAIVLALVVFAHVVGPGPEAHSASAVLAPR